MSWFDTTGLANIAKTALKEAQKTIDKALDIRDDDYEESCNFKEKSGQDAADDSLLLGKQATEKEVKEDKIKTSTMPTSNWGSFSGSFFQFDPSKCADKKPLLISTQPQKSLNLLNSDVKDEISGSTIGEKEVLPSYVKSKNLDGKKLEENGNGKDSSAVFNTSKTEEEVLNCTNNEIVITRVKGRRNSSSRNSYVSNRLSVISTDSDGKKSSESVEVLGSISCATSPDTDLPSVSTSSSLGLPVSSSCTDSVEVIDSLASPSSIEVLVEGTGSSQTTQSSSKDGNLVNQNSVPLKMFSSPISSLNDVSPESFEVIPDLPAYDEELSMADSYTSASESTGATVLEPSCQYSYRMTESFTDLSQASSKFCSGDSTPDVVTKLPLLPRSSCDILSESIHEVPGFDVLPQNQNKSTDTKKSLLNCERSGSKCLTPESVFEGADENQNQSNRLIHGSPVKKKFIVKSDDWNFWNKSGEVKYVKSDINKSELVKTHGTKKDFEECEVSFPGIDRSDLNAEEISGSGSSYSDTRTIVANDSSCDEIALESSSEDIGNANASESQSNTSYKLEKSEHNGVHNNSYYVKNLISEAIGEVHNTRETSPTLSEKRWVKMLSYLDIDKDLIKVGSEQTSGHTSGDELETTTSSDIEIISRYSPNGDSSSTTSRHSPAKLLHINSKSKLSLVAVDMLGRTPHVKNKGHQREPSEASSFCSEDNASEVEKLSKRVTELTEILEARESRLNDLRKTNWEMQEKNQELKREMEQAKIGISAGLSALQTDSEKDKLIKELKEEGEKLSKKELKQATLIKTLRAQEKSQQAVIESYKSQMQNLTKTLEELKAELSMKKEAEKILTENAKQMNKKITRQDEEIANLLNKMEKTAVNAEELKFLVESKDAELMKCKELLAAEDFELQDAKSIAELKTKQLERLKGFQENAEIELEDLRQQLKKAEEIHSEREKCNRQEKNELMKRLQEAEARNEELAQSVSRATRPLLRQMEALQATTSNERETWEKQERNLIQKLEEAESRLSSIAYHEKSFKQETLELRTKVNNLEDQLQASNQELGTWKYQVSSLCKQLDEGKQTLESEKQSWEKLQESFKSQILELKKEIVALELSVATERANVELEKRKAALLQEQMKEKETHAANRGDSTSPRSSPTLSFGRVSLSESLSSNLWPQFGEDGFDTTSVSGRYITVYDNLRAGNTTSLIESLQAQLKMRDGEISQLQWELQRRDSERASLTAELSSLTSKLEDYEKKLSQAEATSRNLKELQTNYDALLEMYGEKVEEAEELKLDLQDVKEMYKTQIDELLKKERQNVSL